MKFNSKLLVLSSIVAFSIYCAKRRDVLGDPFLQERVVQERVVSVSKEEMRQFYDRIYTFPDKDFIENKLVSKGLPEDEAKAFARFYNCKDVLLLSFFIANPFKFKHGREGRQADSFGEMAKLEREDDLMFADLFLTRAEVDEYQKISAQELRQYHY